MLRSYWSYWIDYVTAVISAFEMCINYTKLSIFIFYVIFARSKWDVFPTHLAPPLLGDGALHILVPSDYFCLPHSDLTGRHTGASWSHGLHFPFTKQFYIDYLLLRIHIILLLYQHISLNCIEKFRRSFRYLNQIACTFLILLIFVYCILRKDILVRSTVTNMIVKHHS